MSEIGSRLAGKVAVVTGAGGGIGAAVSRRFHDAGARVVLADIDVDSATTAAAAIDASTTSAIPIRCDVTSEQSAAATIDAALDTFGRLDILVNNAAARTPNHTIDTLRIEDWDTALAVNLTGAFLMSRLAVPIMAGQRAGVIIHMSSQLGHVGAPLRSAYGATKAALIALARSMAVDHGPDGIRVVSLSPGAVLTGRLEERYGSLDAASAALADRYPAGRLGDADEVAAAAVYLASDDAAFLTGSDLLIDGGYTAR